MAVEQIEVDLAKVDELMGRLIQDFAGAGSVPLTLIGIRTGLWTALAGAGPLTPAEVADAGPGRMDALVDELARATGLGGRPRRLGDERERARKAVTALVRDALGRIEQAPSPPGRHLRGRPPRGRPAPTLRGPGRLGAVSQRANLTRVPSLVAATTRSGATTERGRRSGSWPGLPAGGAVEGDQAGAGGYVGAAPGHRPTDGVPHYRPPADRPGGGVRRGHGSGAGNQGRRRCPGLPTARRGGSRPGVASAWPRSRGPKPTSWSADEGDKQLGPDPRDQREPARCADLTPGAGVDGHQHPRGGGQVGQAVRDHRRLGEEPCSGACRSAFQRRCPVPASSACGGSRGAARRERVSATRTGRRRPPGRPTGGRSRSSTFASAAARWPAERVDDRGIDRASAEVGADEQGVAGDGLRTRPLALGQLEPPAPSPGARSSPSSGPYWGYDQPPLPTATTKASGPVRAAQAAPRCRGAIRPGPAPGAPKPVVATTKSLAPRRVRSWGASARRPPPRRSQGRHLPGHRGGGPGRADRLPLLQQPRGQAADPGHQEQAQCDPAAEPPAAAGPGPAQGGGRPGGRRPGFSRPGRPAGPEVSHGCRPLPGRAAPRPRSRGQPSGQHAPGPGQPDLTVPTGTRSSAATCSTGRSSRWWRTTTLRWATGRARRASIRPGTSSAPACRDSRSARSRTAPPPAGGGPSLARFWPPAGPGLRAGSGAARPAQAARVRPPGQRPRRPGGCR